jgi:hypothetical protein
MVNAGPGLRLCYICRALPLPACIAQNQQLTLPVGRFHCSFAGLASSLNSGIDFALVQKRCWLWISQMAFIRRLTELRFERLTTGSSKGTVGLLGTCLMRVLENFV